MCNSSKLQAFSPCVLLFEEMIEIDPVIIEYEHEKFRPREAEALQTLRRIASLVKPIMRRRGWEVGILTEFWPPEKNLLGLNWNKGQKICLRLRYPYDERQFLPLEEVVDTMLHELCHIIHGPHDEPFHTLWNQLRTEHEQLIRKGYTGEGFLSTGHRLGGGSIPMHEAQRRARAAAEKRRILTAGSGQKLGGSFVSHGKDIRQVIADAATRRINAVKSCASGTERGRAIIEETTKTGFKTKADEENANEEAIMLAYIDLIEEEEKEKYGTFYIPPSKENPAGRHEDVKGKSPELSEHSSSPTVELTPNPPEVPYTSWACEICTLVNPSTFLCCDACSTERTEAKITHPPSKLTHLGTTSRSTTSPLISNRPNPKSKVKKSSIQSLISLENASKIKPPSPIGWVCHRCGNFMENEWWTCARCGVMKLAT